MNIRQLIQESKSILAANYPAKAAVLLTLASLDDNDVERLQNGSSLEETSINRIAAKTKQHVKVVRDVLCKRLLSDMSDYSSYYSSVLEKYVNSNNLKDKIDAIFKEYSSSHQIHFILHEQLQVWDPSTGQLSDFIIEELDEDDVLPSAMEGYLVSKGFAFPTSLKLLDDSSKSNWENWQSLWGWF